MPPILRLHVTVDPEPPNYHGTMRAAVFIGIECQGDSLDPAARLVYERMGNWLPDLSFALYPATKDANSRITLVGPGGPIGETAIPSTTTAFQAVYKWLEHGEANKAHYWCEAPPIAGGADVQAIIDADSAGATHRLRGAQAWDAPVAHSMRLTRLLDLPTTWDSTKPFIALPYFGPNVPDVADITAGAPIGSGPLSRWDFTNYLSLPHSDDANGFAVAVCTHVIPGAVTSPLGGLLDPYGFLKVGQQVDETKRHYDLVESHLADWLTADPLLEAIIKCLAPPDNKVEPAIEFLKPWLDNAAAAALAEALAKTPGLQTKWSAVTVTKPDKDPVTTYTLTAPALAWAVVARLTASLDPIVLTLTCPGTEEGEGPVTSVLVSKLIKAIAEAGFAAAKPLPVAARNAEISSAVRTAIRALPGFSAQSTSAPELIAVLRDVARLLGEGGNRALDALFTCYEKGEFDTSDAELANDIARLPLAGGTPPTGVTPGLSRTIGNIVAALRQERGTEDTIKLLLAPLLPDANRSKEAALYSALNEALLNLNAGDDDTDKLAAAIDTARQAFHASFDDKTFNGALVVRRRMGVKVVKYLVSASPSDPNMLPDAAKRLVEAQEYLAQRFGPSSTDPAHLAPLLKQLPKLTVPGQMKNRALQCFIDLFGKEMSLIANRTVALAKPVNFVADCAPAALPIRICPNFNADSMKEFLTDYCGIGIAIRRRDDPEGAPPSDRWAHANLASFKCGHGGEGNWFSINSAIAPVRPAICNDQVPMFLGYEGVPFSTAVMARTGPDGEQMEDARQRSFYTRDVADFSGGSGYAALPALCYGRTFEVTAFAISKGGSLPKALQLDKNEPWQPKKEISLPQSFDPIISTISYQRRTAISAVQVVDDATRSGRIGASISGVRPLATDYPRLVVSAFEGAGAVIDLWRDAAGGGRLGFPEVAGAPPLEYRIDDIRTSGAACTLTLGFVKPGAHGVSHGTHEIQCTGGTAPTAIIIRLFTDSGNTYRIDITEAGGDPVDLVPGGTPFNGEPIWLRLDIAVGAGSASASISFSDPDDAARNRSDGLLLLRPGSRHECKIKAPRVSYTDFDRWFSNPDLRKSAFGNVADLTVRRFFNILWFAYTQSYKFRSFVPFIANLPDPSIRELRIELAISDTITGDTETGANPLNRPALATVNLQNAFQNFVKESEGKTPPFLLKKEEDGSYRDLENDQEFEAHIIEFFLYLYREFDRQISIGRGEFGFPAFPHDPAENSPIEAKIPPGVVAGLSVWPVVDEGHFHGKTNIPAVFHEGILELSPRKVSNGRAFPPTSIQIETIPDNAFGNLASAETLIAAAIKCLAPPQIRRHELVVTPSKLGRFFGDWRWFSRADVKTQRWSPSGRPLYNYIDPTDLVDDAAIAPWSDDGAQGSEVHALPLRNDHSVLIFEDEAFFGRADGNAVTTNVDLQPLPPKSRLTSAPPTFGQFTLEAFPWNQPSATYFRHDFRLWSRYAGAFPGRQGYMEIRPRAGVEVAWSMRVAILADLGRIDITRPQLRALLPLTATPGGARAGLLAPPVLALLQEPPYAQGGLADRIAAEIKTGLNWGFAQPAPAKVQVLDLRKEIGRDPRLTYSAFPEALAASISLEAEGPVGLTFDSDKIPMQTFANSAFVMTPRLPDGQQPVGASEAGDLQEHFLGTVLRRYFDPRWVVTRSKQGPPDPDQTWWFEWTVPFQPGSHRLLTHNGQDDDDGRVLSLKIGAATDGRQEAWFVAPHQLLYEQAPADKPDLEIAHTFRPARDEPLTFALLHQRSAPNHFHASIFILSEPPAADEKSQDRMPAKAGQSPLNPRAALIGSFHWFVGGPPTLALQARGTATRTLASAATALAWTRTQRDFGRWVSLPLREDCSPLWTALGADAAVEARIQKVGDIAVIELRSDRETPTWLRPSTHPTANNPLIPLHVHRHLALIGTSEAAGPGRTVERFSGAVLYDRRTLPATRLTDKDGSGLDFIRLVEFETPAAILCNRTNGVPTTYQKAYFDRLSRGIEGDKRLFFFFRLIAPAATLRQAKSLTVVITGIEPTLTVRVALEAVVQGQKSVHSEAFMLDIADGAKATATVIRSDGSVKKTENLENVAGLSRATGLFLQLAAAEPDCELWCDVSLLASKRDEAADTYVPFDFRWLFPDDPTDLAEPRDLVAPEVLRQLHEAQARIIAVSPAIPVSIS